MSPDDPTFPRRWRVDGKPVPGQDELDAIFSNVMQRLGVRAGSVAIAREAVVYVARAYTWAEDDWPTTRTTTTFRIASVSKAFTSAAVRSLADSGAINLDAPVFAYLGLNSTMPHDPRADTTIMTKHRYGYVGRNSAADAYQHMVWIALMTVAMGPGTALAIGSRHEQVPVGIGVGQQPLAERTMDLHNNNIGALIGIGAATVGGTGPLETLAYIDGMAAWVADSGRACYVTGPRSRESASC